MRHSQKRLPALLMLSAGILGLPRFAVSPSWAQTAGSTAEAAGVVFQTLTTEDLDMIEKETGHRVGVSVADVKPDTPGARAGIKAGDVIFVIGKTGVADAKAAADAIGAASGTVEVLALTQSGGEYVSKTYSLDLSGGPAVAPGPLSATTGGASTLRSKVATAEDGSASTGSAGWQLEALDQQGLDKIEKASGYRVGVYVAQVAPGSPAAQAGIRRDDILLVVGSTGVDSPPAVEKALASQSGPVKILAMRPGQEKFEMVECTMTLTAGTAPAGRTTAVAQDDPVAAYFDMFDFIRTQAWGKPVSTPADQRQQAAAQLQQAWSGMDAETQGAVLQISQTWAAIQQNWAQLSDDKKAAQREEWRRELLLPGQPFASLSQVWQTFRAEDGSVAFEYPPDWVGGQTEAEGMQLLYLGPPGTQAAWDSVLNDATSPPGALFGLIPASQEIAGLGSWVDRARFVAQQTGVAGSAGMREINVLDIPNGAIITYLGRHPGQTEEKFSWVGIMAFGSGRYFAGRTGGPTSQAGDLVPIFQHMLVTMQLAAPSQGGGGGGGGEATSSSQLAWDTFQSKTAASTWKAWGAGTEY